MKSVKCTKIVPSSQTETLVEEIKKASRRGKIYETRVVPPEGLSGPKHVFRTTNKDLHLGLGLLSEMAQNELAWFLCAESENGKSDLRVEDADDQFMFCTIKVAEGVVYLSLDPAN